MYKMVKICFSWNVGRKSIGARDKILRKDYKNLLNYVEPKFNW